MSEKRIERIELREEELRGDLERVKEALGEESYRRLKYVIDTLLFVTQLLERKRASIKRLKNLLFGPRSEKSRKVLKEPESEPEGREDQEVSGEAGEGNTAKENSAEKGKPRRGHGRNGAEKYVGAEVIEIPHESLKSGDPCPSAGCEGRVYHQREPATLVRIVGQSSFRAEVIERERLRCNLCLMVFTAKAPEGTTKGKYDASAVSMMAILRYGSGMPLYRLEKLQESLGIPLPSSTQWDVVKKAFPIFVPVHEELIRQGAQAEVIHNDDSSMKILQVMKELGAERERGEAPERTGVFTSAIVTLKGEIRIALFFTGREHAGENLSKVLAERAAELPPPVQMCDALAQNISREFETILCSCMSHARRQYVDLVESFPQECRFVIDTLRGVFRNDAIAREKGMSPQERLEFHREKSFRAMAELRLWMLKALRDRRVEPNSSLGDAMAYMRRHWRKLTRFLFTPGAPLENNLVERILKKAICHRKNSLFYKTLNGARVGDLYMSLIATCQLAGANPFDYLSELQRHAAEVAEEPAKWLPWNYRQQLDPAPG